MKLCIHQLSKAFHGLPVLNQVNLELEQGRLYCLMGPSGSGKTTLFRILMGLETPDSGTFQLPDPARIAAVFQENRLCDTFSPIDNTAMVLPGPTGKARERAARELAKLLPEESLTRPVSTLSGGMKRRCAICRAVLAPSDILLMDEPFTGLDEETKKKVISYILEMTSEKLVMISTHQEEDIALLHASLITLPS